MKLFRDDVDEFNRRSSQGNEVDVVVGANLRLLRHACGLSVDVVATLVRVESGDIDLFEVGAIRPKPQVMLALADVLGVAISSFFEADMLTEKQPSILVH